MNFMDNLGSSNGTQVRREDYDGTDHGNIMVPGASSKAKENWIS